MPAVRAELNAQRQFFCELDSVLSTPKELSMPKDFARIVSARAESDMRGVRSGGERRRALLVCLTLALAAFVLLGATAGNSLLGSAALLANKVLGVLSLLWTTFHDAVIGMTIVSRVFVRVFLPESPLTNLAALVVLVLAVGSLSHLIIRYHRRGQMRLSDKDAFTGMTITATTEVFCTPGPIRRCCASSPGSACSSPGSSLQ